MIALVVFVLVAAQPVVSADEPSKSAVYTITANYEVTNEGPSTVSKVDVHIRLYKDLLNQSVLSREMAIDEQPQTMNIETDAENNQTVHVALYNLPPRKQQNDHHNSEGSSWIFLSSVRSG